MGLLPTNWTAAILQKGDFATLDGTPFGVPFSGFIYTTVVPLPPSALLLAAALVRLARRQVGRRSAAGAAR